jgi:hypothetical protein
MLSYRLKIERDEVFFNVIEGERTGNVAHMGVKIVHAEL